MKISLDAVDLFLAVEAAKKGAAESPPGSNAGPYVERVLAVTHTPKGSPWCAADVADTGTIAFGAKWPLPLTASCQELADFGRKQNALYRTPIRGDLWLLWSESLGRFAHTGVVLSVPDPTHIEVQAGNTVRPNAGGDIREGWLNWTRTEPVGEKDRFLRWSLLLTS